MQRLSPSRSLIPVLASAVISCGGGEVTSTPDVFSHQEITYSDVQNCMGWEHFHWGFDGMRSPRNGVISKYQECHPLEASEVAPCDLDTDLFGEKHGLNSLAAFWEEQYPDQRVSKTTYAARPGSWVERDIRKHPGGHLIALVLDADDVQKDRDLFAEPVTLAVNGVKMHTGDLGIKFVSNDREPGRAFFYEGGEAHVVDFSGIPSLCE